MSRVVGPAESAMVQTLGDRRMSLRQELSSVIQANTELKKAAVIMENRTTRDLRASARRLQLAREEIAELKAALASARAEA